MAEVSKRVTFDELSLTTTTAQERKSVGQMSPTDAAISLPPASCHQSKKPYYCSALLRTHFYGFFYLIWSRVGYAMLQILRIWLTLVHPRTITSRKFVNWGIGGLEYLRVMSTVVYDVVTFHRFV